MARVFFQLSILQEDTYGMRFKANQIRIYLGNFPQATCTKYTSKHISGGDFLPKEFPEC